MATGAQYLKDKIAAQNQLPKAQPDANFKYEIPGSTKPNTLAQIVQAQKPEIVGTPPEKSTNDIAKIVGSGNTGNTTTVTPKETPAPTVTATPPKVADNSGMINDQYSSLVSALKAQIQQRQNEKNMAIQALPEKYQPMKNDSEVAKTQQVRTLGEMAANAGDRGGIGRQNTLNAMTEGENRLNSIDLQMAAEKRAIENDIQNLMLEGNVQEAQFQAQKLKDLIANQNYVDNTNYQRQFDAEGRQLSVGQFDKTFNQNQDRFNTEQDNWLKSFNQNTELNTQKRNDQIMSDKGLTADGQKTATTIQNEIANRRQQEADALTKTQIMAGLTGNIPAQVLISQMDPSMIASYENLGKQNGGFAAAMASTTDHVQRAILEAFRNRYLQQNPNNPYANTQTANVMVPTMQGQQLQSALKTDALQQSGLELANKLNNLKIEAFPEEQQLSIESAKLALESGREDLAIKIIQKSQLPDKFKMEMRVSESNINQNNASADNARASAEYTRTQKGQVDENKPFTTQQKNQYYSEARAAIKALSVSDAQKALEQKRQEIETRLGPTEYIRLYNDVLAGAGIKYNEPQ